MIKRHALIQGTQVINVVDVEVGFTSPGMTFVLIPDGTAVSPGWTYSGGKFTAPVEVPVSYGSRITKLAFRNRFTTAEKVAIELASIDNPNGTTQARQLAASLRANQKDMEVATFIDLSRADTRAGVQALETAGLIGTGRATQILDTPVTSEEVPLQ